MKIFGILKDTENIELYRKLAGSENQKKKLANDISKIQ